MSKKTGGESPPSTKGVTRRSFLVGTGITAAATVGASVALEGCMPPGLGTGSASPVIGPGRVLITLRVNGVLKRLEVEPRSTLADALRFDLGLTGTKVVCDRGSCSACTVLLDGMPVCACMTFALDVGSRQVTTIEGLADPGAAGDGLHPIQEAFITHDAMQCGFCTPGMIMSCAALLRANPSPTLDDVKTATSGNLCRCGTYPKVFEATLAAAQVQRKSPRKGL